MNTKIDSPNRKKRLAPPNPGVRAICAAFLAAPVLLGAILSFPDRPPFNFCSSLFNFVQDKKSFQKSRDHFEPRLISASSPSSAANQKQSTNP